MSFTFSRYLGVATAAAALATGGALSLPSAAPEPAPADTSASAAPGPEQAGAAAKNKFDMVRSTGAKNAGCLEGAGADVTVKELGAVEKMTVEAHDLPPETPFVLFVTQVPDAPFGIAWYQSDLESDQSGNATVQVRGRFSEETFAIANDSAEAPTPHENGDFPDADENPPFAPIHTFHLGVWFDSPEDAEAAGCPATVTPFNGDHTAGIQALSTRNFVADEGPLGELR